MHQNGMIIGSHSVTHPVMSKLSSKKQKLELELSFRFIKSLINYDHKTYCHPFGGRYSYNNKTLKLLGELGINYTFCVEERDIKNNDILTKRQTLPRYDCNYLPYGKAYNYKFN